MARSLKERHDDKRLKLLQERIKRIDDQVLQENKAAKLLLEAMDQDDLNKVTAIIDKLNSIKTPQLPKLNAAIEQAQAELNKYTAGGPLAKAWTKLKGLVGVDNPVVKITTFANALERGFSQIPNILRNNGIDLKNVDLKKSLASLLGGSSGEKADDSVLGGKGNPPEAGNQKQVGSGGVFATQNEVQGGGDKLKNVTAQLQKALSPGGIFGAFKKVPYISSQELAQELTMAPLNVFSQVAKKVQSGAKAADIAPDLKAQVTGQGEEQTKHTGPEDPTKPSQQSQPAAPSKPTTSTTGTTPPGEHPATGAPGARGGGAPPAQNAQKVAFERLKDTGIFRKMKLSLPSAQALLKALDDMGALKVPE